MKEMRLPAYPLLPLDPMMSIWSADDRLYGSPTRMWNGHEKPIGGHIVADGVPYRFMGTTGAKETLTQKKVEIDLTSTKYTFFNEKILLEVTFTTPYEIGDIKSLSLPMTYITFTVKSADGKKHEVEVLFDFGEELISRNKFHRCDAEILLAFGGKAGRLGRRAQHPLSYRGDRVDCDWGNIYVGGKIQVYKTTPKAFAGYLRGENRLEGKGRKQRLIVEKSATVTAETPVSAFFMFCYDEGPSVEYFGEPKYGYWKKYYPDMLSLMKDGVKNYDAALAACARQDKELRKRAERFGEDYYGLLIASYRQVLAAHKLIEADGEPILISKECSSNGCAATVDIAYPTAPLFLTENPSLIPAVLKPVFRFAASPAWQYDFAPHDVGVYPYLDGQAYGLRNEKDHKKNRFDKRKPLFERTEPNLYRYESQMPVEESGNMIILCYAYYSATGDTDFIRENGALLEKWADYLVKKGIDLELQLSTDDFGGKLPKNVNLAIKSVLAIALWGRLSDKLGRDGTAYTEQARQLAKELTEKADRGDRLALTLDDRNGWSVKYNLVWDGIFGLNLFGEEIGKRESKFYAGKMNRYGLPMDSRHTYAKTDWMMWAALLDGRAETVGEYAKRLADFLRDTTSRVPHSDLIETTLPYSLSDDFSNFYARSVLGGLWLPLFSVKEK